MVGKRRQGRIQFFATDDPAVAEASLDSLFTEYPSFDLSPTFVPKRPTTVSGRASASAARRTQTAAVEHQDDRTEYADYDDAHEPGEFTFDPLSRCQPATHRRGLSFRPAQRRPTTQLEKWEEARPKIFQQIVGHSPNREAFVKAKVAAIVSVWSRQPVHCASCQCECERVVKEVLYIGLDATVVAPVPWGRCER
jgi:hypothetical protein